MKTNDNDLVYPLTILMDLQLYTAAMLLTHSHSFFLNTCTINPDHWFPQMTIYFGNWMKCANGHQHEVHQMHWSCDNLKKTIDWIPNNTK